MLTVFLSCWGLQYARDEAREYRVAGVLLASNARVGHVRFTLLQVRTAGLAWF